jgi:hypothetical protein
MEIGTLIAYFKADTSHFDAGAKRVHSSAHALETSVHRVTEVLREVGAASVVLEGPFGGISSRMRALSTLATGLGGSFGMAGIGVAGLGAASLTAAGLIFELAKQTAEFGDDIFKAHEKTALSVETLSALKVAGQQVGVELSTMTTGLVRFSNNLEAAAAGNKKLAGELGQLGITAFQNSDKALQQFIGSFAKLSTNQERVTAASAVFGARFGANLIEVFNRVGGNMEDFKTKLREMGLLLSDEEAEAAHEFQLSIERLQQQLSGAARQIGQETIPAFEAGFQALEAAMAANKQDWKSWGEDIAMTILTVEAALGGLVNVLKNISWTNLIPFYGEKKVIGEFISGTTSTADKVTSAYKEILHPSVGDVDMHIGGDLSGKKRFGLAGGGGGGGKGEDPAKTAERIAKLQLAAVVAGLTAEQDANKRSLDIRREDFNTYATKYMSIENRRHKAVVDGLKAEEIAAGSLKKGRDVALLEIANKVTAENVTHEKNRNVVLDERGKILDKINDFIEQQAKDISGITSQTSEWDRAYEDLVKTLKDEGVTLEENTAKRIRANVEMAKERDLILSVTRAREVLKSVRDRVVTKGMKDRPDWIDLGGGSTVGGEPGTTTRGRVVTAQEQGLRDRIAKIREQMTQLAGDLTSVFSQSISAGFNNGIKSGLQTLAQGLLQIVEQVFLKRLAEGLANILTNSATGGGWLQTLLKIGGAAAGGGIGAGAGAVGGVGAGAAGVFAGFHASGGSVGPGQWGIAGERGPEAIYGGMSGLTVQPHGSGQQVVNHYTINLPPAPRGSYVSPKSARQQADMILAALQGGQS